MEARNLPAGELAVWRQEHAPDCCKNHHLSSKAMEQEAAKVMWGLSVEKFGFHYVDMLSDGDSTAYMAVCDLNPYNPQQVNKQAGVCKLCTKANGNRTPQTGQREQTWWAWHWTSDGMEA